MSDGQIEQDSTVSVALWSRIPSWHICGYATVDAEDAQNVAAYSWHINNGYARARTVKGGPYVYMHRLVLGQPDSVVDHRNGNGLDNRKANLRACLQAENTLNAHAHRGKTSRYKGVSWDGRRSGWRVEITINKKTRYVGKFTDEVVAALAYDNSARELFGKFARLNFPTTGEEGALT